MDDDQYPDGWQILYSNDRGDTVDEHGRFVNDDGSEPDGTEDNMEEQTSQYAVIELFGHKTIAGRVTKETTLFPLLRIDVPATSVAPEFTVEYGPAAIYGITYVSEAVARATAESLKVKPIAVYNPELVTRAEFEKMMDEYRQQIAGLRALPERAGRNLRPFEQEGFGEDEDDDC